MITIRSGLSTQSGGGGISSRIYASTKPTKLNYIEGEQLDLSGMVINFKDGDNEPLVISDFKSIPANGSILSRNDEAIQVEYQRDDVTYLLAIPIKVKYPVAIEIFDFKNAPNPTEIININKLSLKVIYNDGSFYIKNDTTGITTEPPVGSTLDKGKSLKINYGAISTNYILKNADANIGENASKIVTFGSGTWSEIKEFISAVEAGKYNIKNYWKVGDYRYEKLTSIKISQASYIPIEYDVKFIILDLDNHTDAMSKYNAMISNISIIDTGVILGEDGSLSDNYESLIQHVSKMFVLNKERSFHYSNNDGGGNSITTYTPTNNRGYIQRLFKDQTVNLLMKEVLFFSLIFADNGTNYSVSQSIFKDRFIPRFSLYELFGESMYNDNKFKHNDYTNFKFDKNAILNGIYNKRIYNPVHLEYFKTASNVRTHSIFKYNTPTNIMSVIDPLKENMNNYVYLRDRIPKKYNSGINYSTPIYSFYNDTTKQLAMVTNWNLNFDHYNSGYITFCI